MIYILIPSIALLFYILLFIGLTAAKKSETLYIFMILVLGFILWTMGSVFMRLQLYPSVEYWCNVSLAGMFLIPSVYYIFVCSFLDVKSYFQKYIFIALTIISELLVMFNQLLVNPKVIIENGNAKFLFDVSWTILIPVVLVLWVFVAVLYKFYRHIKKSDSTIKDYSALIFGSCVLAIGTVASSIPEIGVFPIDTLSGIIFAICLFYSLYAERIIKLQIVISKSTTYAATGLTSALLVLYLVTPIENFIKVYFPTFEKYSTSFVVILLVLLISIVYSLFNKYILAFFIKDDQKMNEALKEYSQKISRHLKMEDISSDLINIVKKELNSEKVYLCLKDDTLNAYVVKFTGNELDEKEIRFSYDNPIVDWIKQENRASLFYKFKSDPRYKLMWEKEKNILNYYNIECIVPLICEDELIGILALSNKDNNRDYTISNLMLLDSITSISSIGLKNSSLYELIYQKASLDNLTGLLNREFFMKNAEEIYVENKNNQIAFLILNIDDFSLYNELYGRSEGDKKLKAIGSIIDMVVDGRGITGRFSSKEFSIILPDADGRTAMNIAKNIVDRIKNEKDYQNDDWVKAITMSIGISIYPYNCHNLQELITSTEMAVFKAKQNGKNQIVMFNNDSVNPSGEIENNKNVYNQYAATIYALTAAIDVKDHYTFNHSDNVAYYATELAKAKGLNHEQVEMIKEASLLHDIGKIGIPENILNKTEKLNSDEYQIMKTHVENSISIIKHLPSLNYVIPAVIGHHERWDGKGYPRGIMMEDIPLAARCLAIADAFDAMTTARSYREPLNLDIAIQEIVRGAGKQFDPELALLFVQLVNEHKIIVKGN